MLGFIKNIFRRETPRSVEDNALQVAAGLIQLQLALSSSAPTFRERLCHPYARGYLFGIFDAHISLFATDEISEEERANQIALGHFCALDQFKSVEDFINLSFRLVREPEFISGQVRGGEEYVSFINTKRTPMQLAEYLRGAE